LAALEALDSKADRPAPNLEGNPLSGGFAFIIPVFNQAHYTEQCLRSLQQIGVANADVVVVDNASTDETGALLAAQPHIRLVSNARNLGCSTAWNQGVEAAGAEWSFILNNDVVVAAELREGMVRFAQERHCDIVSPAMGEGELDYDPQAFGKTFIARMEAAHRAGVAFGSCFMVHRRVFEAIGGFDTQLGQAGYEDEDFFRRALAAGFHLGVTGKAYLHHFGSITQRSVKTDRGIPDSARLSNRDYFRQKHHLGWVRRRTERMREKLRGAYWRWNERRRFGMTLRMWRRDGQWHFA
jgi:GT2 family glycosyltransferase